MSWKALRHPNVLPLLGVIMTKAEFSMVSDWMPNGNITQFVAAHPDAKRFELVCSSFRLPHFSPVADGHMVHVVGRRRKGLDLHARSGYDPWRSQGSASLKVVVIPSS